MRAIRVRQGLCKNCYACIRACEVKATSIKQGQAAILEEDCLACGACLAVCPQKAREIRRDEHMVHNLLRGATPVWVSLAPSAALGPYSLPQWSLMLTTLGFAGVSLTSWGAASVSQAYADLARRDGWALSTACPAAVKLTQRFFPKLTRYLAGVSSPMVTHAAWLKQTYGCRVVFIGPCAAKKYEAERSGHVDVALTFPEFLRLTPPAVVSTAPHLSFAGQGLMHFPLAGGVANQVDVPVLALDGMDELMKYLARVERGDVVPKGIVEMSACRGSCLGGAAAFRAELSLAEKRAMVLELQQAAEQGAQAVARAHLPEGKRAQASEQRILEALRELGKTEPALEYNCGACGYHTCREKAGAVALGRAELEMCLPFMRAKAESLSNLILASTPNAIVVVDKNLCVQEWNAAAERMFGVPAHSAKGKRVGEFLPEEHFLGALDTLEPTSGIKLSPAPALITALSVVPVKGGDLVMGIYSDITDMEEQGKALAKLRQETVDKAQEVINKQMRVAQDIASLLGETTAESKMLLLKLMRVVQGEKS